MTQASGDSIAGHSQQGWSPTSREGMVIFMHGRQYVGELLQSRGFAKLKELRFLVQGGQGGDDLFCAYAAQREQGSA